MATGTAKPNSTASPPAPHSYGDMVEEHVRRTQGYLRSYDIVRAVITLVVFVLGYLMALAVVDNWLWSGGLGRGGRTLAWLALLGLVGVYFWRAIWPHLFRHINPVYAADRLEHAQPSLMNSLVNFLLLREDERHVPAAVMQGLERQAAAGIAHLPAEAAVDRKPLLRVAYVLVGLISIAALFVVLSPKSPLTAAARILFPWADIAPATRVRIDAVDPGSKDVFRGEPVTVTAAIRGLRDDDAVTLRYASVDGQSVNQSVAMVRPEGEAVYRCQLPPDTAGMQRDLVYQVEAGDAKSKDFVLHVVPAPTIQIENVEYRYPGYTRMDPLVVERLGDIKALEGTQVVIRARASQPIGTASLVLSGSRDTTLGMQTRELAARGELLLKLVRRDGGLTPEYEGYKLVVTNARGESNPQPPTYRIEVIPDLPPLVDIYEPKQRDVKLPVDQELTIDVRARDADFGLSDVRLSATRNGQRLLDQSLVKGQNLRLNQPMRPSFRFAPARLGLQPGDEVLFRVTAIDNKLPQPNRQQTPEYRIEIVGPSDEQLAQNDPRQGQGEKGEQGEQGGTSAKGQEGAKGEQGGAGDKRQEGAKGEQGGQSEKGDGQKDQSEKGDGAQSGGAQGNQDQGGDKSQSGEGGKSGQEANDDAPRDPLDDGQAVQEIVKHLEQQGKKPQDQPTQQDGKSEQGEDQVASAKEEQGKQEQAEPSDGQGGDNSGQQNQPQPGQQQQQDPKQDSSQQQSGGNQQGDQNTGSQKDGQQQDNQQKNGLKPQPEQQQGGAQQGGGGASEQQDGKQEGAQGNSGQGGASGNQQGSSAGDSKTAEGMSGSKQDGSQQSGSQQGNSNPSGAGDKKGDRAGEPGNNQGSKSGTDQGGMKQPGQRAGEANAQNQPGQSQQDQQAAAGEENQQGTGSQPSQKKDAPAAGSQQKPGHDPQRGTQEPSGEKSSAAQKQNPGTKADGAQKAGDQVASNEPRQNQSGEKSTDAKPGKDESADQKAGEKSDGTKPPGLKPGERDPQTTPEKQPDASSGGKPQSGGPQGRQQKDGNSSDGNRPNDEAKDLTQKSGESSDNRSSGKASDKPQEKTRAPGKTPSKGEQAPSDSQSSDEDSKNPERQRPSDTGSDQSGERAGKGPEGMGQQSSGAGGGSAGKNQAADDGGSRSPQSGPGDQGSKAGNQQQTDKKTGQTGTKPGDARQGRPEDSQQASAENRQGNKTESSEPKPDAQQGKHPGEGQPTGGESAEPSSGSGGDPGASGRSGPSNTKPMGDVVAGSDQLNLDYAKKATDLTLEYLQDQLAKGKVDGGLRKRLGWSEEEFQSLLKRMQAMRDRGADAQARPEDKLAYEQWLKSLGLRPSSGAIRTGRPETKTLDRSRDDAQINVPRDLREQHEAFRRGLLEKIP